MCASKSCCKTALKKLTTKSDFNVLKLKKDFFFSFLNRYDIILEQLKNVSSYTLAKCHKIISIKFHVVRKVAIETTRSK
jgi:hypothetical protein